MRKFNYLLLISLFIGLCLNYYQSNAQEKLDRGVVAVRSGNTDVFISWRLLETDPADIGFNIYRSADGAEPVKLNESVLSVLNGGTNFTDNTADLSQSKSFEYSVKPVINGVESSTLKSAINGNNRSAEIGKFKLEAAAAEPYFSINLRSGANIHFCFPGDFNGDGQMDYAVDRLDWGNRCYLEVYKHDGTFMWGIDYGPNSANTDNISPGSATIDVGHWDGVTTADLNGDGKWEVITKIANGTKTGDGSTWTNSDNNKQWIAVLDGATGAILRYAAIPTDYLSVGPVACQLGVGNGNKIFLHAKNRNSNGSFNVINAMFEYTSSALTQRWKTTGGHAEGHQIRVCDVNGDGTDDLCHIGYVLNGTNGSIMYQISNIIHGDRFHIGKFDPNRSGLQGFGVQQNNGNSGGISEFYYDARNGSVIWTHGGNYDNGRGNAADLDPRYPGYEVWSFNGIYNAAQNIKLTDEPNRPWPNFRIWWDGDNLSECFDAGKVEKWNYSSSSVQRLLTVGDYGAVGSDRGAPLFYGDIMGDWREEIIMKNSTNNKLFIFTTNISTSISRSALTSDRYYKNDLTCRGYLQSHHTSYYIGDEGGGGGGGGTTYYKMQNRGTGLYIDGMGRTTNGSNCGQYSGGSSNNQQWIIESAGSYVKIKNRATGLYIDGMGRTTNGSICGQYSGGSSNNQQWTQESAGSYVKFKNRATGLYLDGMGRTTNGSDLGQYSSSSSNNQQFTLTSLKSATLEPEALANENKAKVTILPNPVINGKTRLNLELSSASEVKISIVNLVGKVVYNKNIGVHNSGILDTELDITSLKKGTYILRVSTNDGDRISKLLNQ